MNTHGSLEEARAELRRLEEPLVRALKDRGGFLRGQPSQGVRHHPEVEPRLAGCYDREIVPFLCAAGSDDREDACAAADGRLLELLARRVRLGVLVADAKARDEPERFAFLVAAGNRASLAAALTNGDVERQVLERVRLLARPAGGPPEPAVIVEIFERWIIPLTKEAEVDRLLTSRPGGTQTDAG